MKAKSSAKGDPTIPRGNRFAFTVLFAEELGAESKLTAGQGGKPLILYFDNRGSIGQMLDQICKQMNLNSCSDFNDPQSS